MAEKKDIDREKFHDDCVVLEISISLSTTLPSQPYFGISCNAIPKNGCEGDYRRWQWETLMGGGQVAGGDIQV